MKKTGENAELTAEVEKKTEQKRGTVTDSTERSNESESMSSDSAHEEKSEKSRKLIENMVTFTKLDLPIR